MAKNKKKNSSFSEDVLLVYFDELAKNYAAPSLWSTYSMLKACIGVYDNINIENYRKLQTFLKGKSVGHIRKKSKVFTADEIAQFCNEAADPNLLVTKATDMLSLVRPRRATLPAYPPVFTSVGGDLRQFVAVQEIPNFGLHGYYAISIEPLSKWSQASTNIAKKTTIKPKHYADCFKNTCMLAESTYCPKNTTTPDAASSPPSQFAESQHQQLGTAQSYQAPVHSENTGLFGNRRPQNKCKKIPAGPMTQFVPPPPISLQSLRKNIAGYESRPSWGRSRYIERLIDESPHLTADLDVSQADAMLNVMSEKTFKKAENYGPCAISNNRRRIERMLDLPPCAVDPGELKPNSGSLFTCCSKGENATELHTDICQSERDFYSCGKRSNLSLREGSKYQYQ